MNEIELYIAIRNEIIVNHVLMHATTLVVVIALLVGVWITEKRTTMLSVLLPLLSVGWAAATLRFDYLIHRQAAYLRAIEVAFTERGIAIPLWESWKASLSSTKIVVPVTDFLIVLVLLASTLYLLLVPAKIFCHERQWQWHGIYAWATIAVFVILLGLLPFIPMMASR